MLCYNIIYYSVKTKPDDDKKTKLIMKQGFFKICVFLRNVFQSKNQ